MCLPDSCTGQLDGAKFWTWLARVLGPILLCGLDAPAGFHNPSCVCKLYTWSDCLPVECARQVFFELSVASNPELNCSICFFFVLLPIEHMSKRIIQISYLGHMVTLFGKAESV